MLWSVRSVVDRGGYQGSGGEEQGEGDGSEAGRLKD